MASSAAVHPASQPRELCRYFLSNACRYGDNCIYSHDRSNGQANNVCRFYLQGKCSYGDRCRYDHVRSKPRMPTVFHPIAFTPDPPYDDSSPPPPLPTPVVNKPLIVNGIAPMSYANVCRLNNDVADSAIYIEPTAPSIVSVMLQSLCPYAEKEGFCEALETGRYCPYIHGDLCDLCEMPALHPTNEKQREQHRLECLRKCEEECDEAFAIQRSQEKKCGVCLETVWDRDGDKRFGILENCDHIFCLECIRKWRASSNYENKVVKACPECRVKSDFVTPTKYWPENDTSKKELIKAYKDNLQQIHCKFFKRGDGLCPFGSKCFYLHVDKHGQTVQLAPPRRRQRLNARGELENFSDIMLASVFSHEDFGQLFNEYDFLFDDDDGESFGSYLTDEDELRFTDDNNLSENDEDAAANHLWH